MDERENTFDRIVRHIGLGPFLKYFVGWFGNTPNETTIEPTEHILQQFITRYWRRTQRQQGSRTKNRHTPQNDLN